MTPFSEVRICLPFMSSAITDSDLRYYDALVLGRSAPDTLQGRYPAREVE